VREALRGTERDCPLEQVDRLEVSIVGFGHRAGLFEELCLEARLLFGQFSRLLEVPLCLLVRRDRSSAPPGSGESVAMICAITPPIDAPIT